MTHALLPCPHCGHQPFAGNLIDSLHPTGRGWRDEADGFRHYLLRDMMKPSDGRVWTFGCLITEGGCGASINADSEAEVVAAWNRREPVAVAAFAWFVSGPKLHRTVYNRAGIELAVQEMIQEDPNSDSDDYTATELVLNVGQVRCFESLPK